MLTITLSITSALLKLPLFVNIKGFDPYAADGGHHGRFQCGPRINIDSGWLHGADKTGKRLRTLHHIAVNRFAVDYRLKLGNISNSMPLGRYR
jgi:hypothetical protein